MDNILLFFIDFREFKQDMFGHHDGFSLEKKKWGVDRESVLSFFKDNYNLELGDSLYCLGDYTRENGAEEGYSDVKISRNLYGYDTCSVNLTNLNYEIDTFIAKQIMVFYKIDNNKNFTLEFSGRINQSSYTLKNTGYSTRATYSNYLYYSLSNPVNENILNNFSGDKWKLTEYDFFSNFINTISLNTKKQNDRGGVVKYRIKDKNKFLKTIKKYIKSDVNGFISKPKNFMNSGISYIQKVSSELGIVFGFNKNEISISWYKDFEENIENNIWGAFFLNRKENDDLNIFDFENIIFNPAKFDFNKIKIETPNNTLGLVDMNGALGDEGDGNTEEQNFIDLNQRNLNENQNRDKYNGVLEVEEVGEKKKFLGSSQLVKNAKIKQFLFQNHLSVNKIRRCVEPLLGQYVIFNIGEKTELKFNNKNFFSNKNNTAREKFNGVYCINKYTINLELGNPTYDIVCGFEHYGDYVKKLENTLELIRNKKEEIESYNNEDRDDYVIDLNQSSFNN